MVKTIKSIITTILTIGLLFSISIAFSACGGKTHKHEFESAWTSNETIHYHKATCEHSDLTQDLGFHVDSDNNGKCDVCGYTIIITKTVDSMESLISALNEKVDIIKLSADILVNQSISIDKKVILDLNGKTISNIESIKNTEANSLISVVKNGNLTITGNGKAIAKSGDGYAIALNDPEAKLTIENGEFIGNECVVYNSQGTLTIISGKFSIYE